MIVYFFLMTTLYLLSMHHPTSNLPVFSASLLQKWSNISWPICECFSQSFFLINSIVWFQSCFSTFSTKFTLLGNTAQYTHMTTHQWQLYDWHVHLVTWIFLPFRAWPQRTLAFLKNLHDFTHLYAENANMAKPNVKLSDLLLNAHCNLEKCVVLTIWLLDVLVIPTPCVVTICNGTTPLALFCWYCYMIHCQESMNTSETHQGKQHYEQYCQLPMLSLNYSGILIIQ